MAEKETELPSEKELSRLPLWVGVAFAARCARRVLPRFRGAWPDAPTELVEAIQTAVAIAEEFSSRSDLHDVLRMARADLSGLDEADAEYFGRDRIGPIDDADEPFSPSVIARSQSSAYKDACAVRNKALAAAAAATKAVDQAPTRDAEIAAIAAKAASEAAANAIVFYVNEGERNVERIAAAIKMASLASKSSEVDRAILADFERLKAARSEGNWTDGTNISPEFFGPLWPAGEPEGWPSAATRSEGIEGLPSKEEIEQLPRWARVAFAARCARRVQPFFKAFWPEAPAEHCEALETAIRIAETAAGMVPLPGDTATSDNATAAASAAADAAGAARAFADSDAAAYAGDVANVAIHTAEATAAAVAPDRAATGNDTCFASIATSAAAAAILKAAADRSRGERVGWARVGIRAMRIDFERLKAAAKNKRWTDETPVPLEFFGPLWPEGEPEGWPSAKTKKKPSDDIPSENELAKLPRWARVAFAARCARRVQPLFKTFWPEASVEDCATVEKAIQITESSANRGGPFAITSGASHADDKATIDMVYAIARVATAAAKTVAANVAEAAASAASAINDSHGNAVVDVVDAALYATDAAVPNCAESTGWHNAVAFTMLMDYERLKATAKKERWTSGTPIPPEFFGPLWPEGAPKGWPPISKHENAEHEFYEQPTIDLYIDPGNASKGTIQEVLMALSDLHVAAGGLGFEFIDDGQFIYAAERAGR